MESACGRGIFLEGVIQSVDPKKGLHMMEVIGRLDSGCTGDGPAQHGSRIRVACIDDDFTTMYLIVLLDEC